MAYGHLGKMTSKQETARLLKNAKQTEWRKQQIAAGGCRECKAAALPDKTRCARCAERATLYWRARYKKIPKTEAVKTAKMLSAEKRVLQLPNLLEPKIG